MKVFHIDQFKCTFCQGWFCPPYNLPYLLPCSHSICSHCIETNKGSGKNMVICPEDNQRSGLVQARINEITKKALQRLMSEQHNFNENTQLDCIKSLSITFDEILTKSHRQIDQLSQLVDEVFSCEIRRIQTLWDKIKSQINRPATLVNSWKEQVKIYLANIRKNYSSNSDKQNLDCLSHYIEEGRKIKMEISQFFSLDFSCIADKIVENPTMCLIKNFTIMGTQQMHQRKAIYREQYQKGQTPEQLRSTLVKTMRMKQTQQQDQLEIPEKCNKRQNSGSKLNGKKSSTSIIKGNKVSCEQSMKRTNQENVEKSESSDRFNQLIRKQPEDNSMQISSFTDNLTHNRRKTTETSHYIQIQQNNATKGLSQVLVGRKSQIHKKQELRPPKSIYEEHSHIQINPVISQESMHFNFLEGNQSQKPVSGNGPLKSIPLKTFTTETNQTDHQEVQQMKGIRKQKKMLSPLYKIPISQKQNEERYKQISPGAMRELYTEGYQEEAQGEEMLLSVGKQCGSWTLGKSNFLKNWQVDRKQGKEEVQIRHKENFDTEKEKMNYIRRIQLMKVEEAVQETEIRENCIELVNFSMQDVEVGMYLSHFDWNQVEVVKLVKTCLHDQHLNPLLNYMVNSKVHTLVLSHNCLTEVAIDALLYFFQMNSTLKSIYLGTNNINTLKAKTKSKINMLKEKGITIYI